MSKINVAELRRRFRAPIQAQPYGLDATVVALAEAVQALKARVAKLEAWTKLDRQGNLTGPFGRSPNVEVADG